MAKEQLHLMIVPYSASGHMIPALLLAGRLARLGFKVSYVCHEFRLEKVKKEAEARACSSPDINFQVLRRNCPTKEQQPSGSGHDPVQLFLWSFRFRPEDGEELMEIIKSSNDPPDCIITDNLLASWAQDLADELNIPRIVLYPSPAMALAFDFYVRHLAEENKLPVQTGALVRIPGISSAALSPLSSDQISGPVTETVPEKFRDYFIANALRIHDAAGVMCNTFSAIEGEACIALNKDAVLNPNKVPFIDIGPLLPDSYFVDDDIGHGAYEGECMAWLDEQPTASVIYISFGSFAKADRKQIEELALGLEASEKKFLWVLHSGNEEFLPEGFLATSRVSNAGMVLKQWAPQLLVLSHRAVGGFMSHCGWNSTMESLSRGVPMITMPFYGEQTGNARIIVEHLQIGVGLEKDGETGLIHRSTFERAFRAVIDDRECLRSNAIRVKEAAGAAFRESPGRTMDFILKVLQETRKAE